MSNQSLLVILLVGIVAGWLASEIVRGWGLRHCRRPACRHARRSSAIGCCRASACTSELEWRAPSSMRPSARLCCSWLFAWMGEGADRVRDRAGAGAGAGAGRS